MNSFFPTLSASSFDEQITLDIDLNSPTGHIESLPGTPSNPIEIWDPVDQEEAELTIEQQFELAVEKLRNSNKRKRDEGKNLEVSDDDESNEWDPVFAKWLKQLE